MSQHHVEIAYWLHHDSCLSLTLGTQTLYHMFTA